MKLVLVIIILLIYVVFNGKCDNITLSADKIKTVPFDEILGYASTNVPAYSNGNDSYISHKYYYLYGIFMGMKWQCVEYARRWLFLRKGCVFGSVDGANDIWNIKYIQRVNDKKCFQLKQYPNGSPNPPQNQSLLIYTRSGIDMPYGHVAIIVDILPKFIRVAEENYYFHYWKGNYSREIPYKFQNGGYYIDDEYPSFGWMTIEDDDQTKPLDQQTINEIIKLNGTSPDFQCYDHITYWNFSNIFSFVSRLFIHLFFP